MTPVNRRERYVCRRPWLAAHAVLLACAATSILGCASPSVGTAASDAAKAPPKAAQGNDLLVVDCLLPGQIRRLGRKFEILTARRPVKTSARDCGIRGGEYVELDRANYATALKIWTPLALEGDPTAQLYLGEIYEKGLGVPPDYAQAIQWYTKAAERGYAPAAINLGNLFEQGLGVPRDSVQALHWYRRAAGNAEMRFEVAAERPAPAPPAPGELAIRLIEPELAPTNRPNVRAVTVQAPVDQVMIVGRVSGSTRDVKATINGRETPIDADGIFKARVPVTKPEEQVRIVASDGSGRDSTVDFLILDRSPTASASPRLPETDSGVSAMGTYHALVIGNDDYRRLRRLHTGVKDATEVAGLLERDYGFKVKLLRNAGRYDILSELDQLRQRLTSSDNLLIYYSGLGDLSPEGQRGHWLPVDAEPDTASSWIATSAITDQLSALPVQQLLVVADSCYSGVLPRSSVAHIEAGLPEQDRAARIRALAQKRSRIVLTSGAVEPVASSGAEHSSFASALLAILRENRESLSGQELFRLVRLRMALAEGLDSPVVPAYGALKYAGHEAGDFVFVRLTRH